MVRQLLMVGVMMPFDGRILDDAVYPLDLTVIRHDDLGALTFLPHPYGGALW